MNEIQKQIEKESEWYESPQAFKEGANFVLGLCQKEIAELKEELAKFRENGIETKGDGTYIMRIGGQEVLKGDLTNAEHTALKESHDRLVKVGKSIHDYIYRYISLEDHEEITPLFNELHEALKY